MILYFKWELLYTYHNLLAYNYFFNYLKIISMCIDIFNSINNILFNLNIHFKVPNLLEQNVFKIKNLLIEILIFFLQRIIFR